MYTMSRKIYIYIEREREREREREARKILRLVLFVDLESQKYYAWYH